MNKVVFSSLGQFWLPANPEQRSFGALSIYEDGSSRLEATGVMLPGIDLFNLDSQSTKRVLGLLDSGEEVCLEDCFIKSGSMSGGGGAKCELFPRIVYRGDEFVFQKQKLFDQIVVEIENLHEWLGISGIHQEYKVAEGMRVPDFTISYKHPGPLSIQLSDYLVMRFDFSFSGPGFGKLVKEVNLSHSAALLLEKKQGMTADDWLATLRPIRMLLQLFIGNPVKVESISGRRLLDGDDSIEEGMRRGLIKIYPSGALAEVEKGKELQGREMSLPYSEISDRLGALVNNWLQLYDRCSDGIHLFYTVFENKHAYLEHNVLSLTQGLETLHRKTTVQINFPEDEFIALKEKLHEVCPKDKREWLDGWLRYSNQVSLRKRLRGLIEPFAPFVNYTGGWKKLVQDTVDTRNYLTHYDGPPEKSSKVMSGLLDVKLRLEGLFALMLFEKIGLSIEEIDQVRRRNRNLNYLLSRQDWPDQTSG